MKKALFFAAVLVAACTMTGCKKDCTCTVTAMGITSTSTFTPDKGTTCKDYNDILKAEVGGEAGVTVSCK